MFLHSLLILLLLALHSLAVEENYRYMVDPIGCGTLDNHNCNTLS